MHLKASCVHIPPHARAPPPPPHRPPKDLGASGNWSWWLSLWKPLTQCFSHSRRYQNPLEELTHSTALGPVEVGQGWGLWLATILPLWLGCTVGLRVVWFQTQGGARRGPGFGLACELVRTLNPQVFAECLRLPSFRLQGDTILEVYCFVLFWYYPLWNKENNTEAAIRHRSVGLQKSPFLNGAPLVKSDDKKGCCEQLRLRDKTCVHH